MRTHRTIRPLSRFCNKCPTLTCSLSRLLRTCPGRCARVWGRRDAENCHQNELHAVTFAPSFFTASLLVKTSGTIQKATNFERKTTLSDVPLQRHQLALTCRQAVVARSV
jgi:hypothetical protein